ncbi:MAG TPA: hypothetical protein IAB04_08300 [Candidatus Avimonoglobus intestinipullorum]|uniref:Vitamin B12 dependent methionine synthase activation subunit n=1 Tax=Candidatus Avimonoglobus intestinipullorum TaxID=2840699 RepID=A0A9D1S730_9FIRM|nr:hypothetical protein [Candidatus Avimonoglobus intestinipullorum]
MIDALDKSEICRYLGYKKGVPPDPRTDALIDACSRAILADSAPKYIYKELPIAIEEDCVRLAGSEAALRGAAIRGHLKGCRSCVLMAVTLGIGADRSIKQSQLRSMAEAVVKDACATAAIEAAADWAEAEINRAVGPCNFRFSPGYGDFPLSFQQELLGLLDAEKQLGLHVNAANLLIPTKSVTAVLGVTNEKITAPPKCARCENRERCAYCKHGS